MQVQGQGPVVPLGAARGAVVHRVVDGVPACPVCRRVNPPDRLLCTACAAELDTGRSLAVWSGALEPAPSGRGRRRGLPARRAVRTVLGLVAAAVVVVGPLRLLGLGPFAPPARLDAAVLLASGYPDPAAALDVDLVGTTSTVAGVVDRDVAPLRLDDGDVTTAWIGAPVDDAGAGEVIDLRLAEPAWVTSLEIRNGDQRSNDAYERSGRLLSGVLTLDGGRAYRIDLLDIGLAAQVVELPRPELTTRISIRVDRTFPGTASRGVALSEVTIVGWTAGAADAALARERARTP